MPEDGTVFGEDPGVSWDALDIGLATNEEDDVTSRLAFDQGIPVRIKKKLQEFNDVLITDVAEIT